MSEQYCPNCHEKAFVWALDEEASPNTLWYCSAYKYHAEENEALENVCSHCGNKTNLYMKAGKEFFRFCTSCQCKTEASPW